MKGTLRTLDQGGSHHGERVGGARRLKIPPRGERTEKSIHFSNTRGSQTLVYQLSTRELVENAGSRVSPLEILTLQVYYEAQEVA